MHRDRLSNLTAVLSLLGLVAVGCTDDAPSETGNTFGTETLGDGDGDGEEPICGDGVVEGSEACDDGNMIETDSCRNDCSPAACGEGVVYEGVEGCDDGNMIDDDECTNTCAAASCGDGVVQAGQGEACDDGNVDNTDDCTDVCQPATCGDSHVWANNETCDDGNVDNTDDCTDACEAPACGDGYLWANNETCDDGNMDDSDECTSACEPAVCGDGYVWANNEACDDGNMLNTDACLDTCVAASCGDGFVQANVEACDDANMDNSDGCVGTCQLAACGDGFLQGGVEACDDGNLANNDGCSSTCTLEVHTLVINDANGVDNAPPNLILDWFNGIQGADPSDFIYFAVFGNGVSGPGAWCSSNADWFRTNYITFYNGGGSINSGNWNKWQSADGVNWSGTVNQGFTNYYGGNCDGTTGSWCTEWGLGGRTLGAFPGAPSSESFGSGFNNGQTTVTIKFGPNRLATCGF